MVCLYAADRHRWRGNRAESRPGRGLVCLREPPSRLVGHLCSARGWADDDPCRRESQRHESWPAFSPDGQRIAFSESDNDGGIFVVGATGESVKRLTDFGFNPTWSPTGDRIAFATEELWHPAARNLLGSALWVVDARGGAPTKLYDGDAMQPSWSPSGARIAFWQSVDGHTDLATIKVDDRMATKLLHDAPLDWSPTWSPDGK